MKSSSINRYIGMGIVMLTLFSCDLEELPVDTADNSAVFGSESGLRLYSNSFYDWLPSANNVHQADAISDYAARRNAPDFLRAGVYSSRVNDNTSASGYDLVALGGDWNWGWGALRNINYFLVNNVNPEIPEEVRNHYNALARFFRAWFYFEKVKRYGDVPWIDVPLDVQDPKLYASQDPRQMVMENVLADINFAIANIRDANEPSRTLITRDVALALKSRIALFEGTFRKYHADLGLNASAENWLRESISAAEHLINSGTYSLNRAGGDDLSYRQLFTSETVVSSEILLAVVLSNNFGIRHAANWYYTSATTGIRFSFIRPFIHTYLNIDGTPFTNTENYQTMVFSEEVQGRDKRLQQTIRTAGYRRINAGESVPAPPAFTYTYTGYQPIKWSMDDVAIDGGNNNVNAVSLFRYAEILLNYAEAKAELGEMSDETWRMTVGALRERAGITGGTQTLPASVDPYLQQVYFPDIADPVLLEVRRERGIELAMEGFRFYDLVRWKRGELMEMQWSGIYVPSANQLIDLNNDGTPDVYFFTEEPSQRVDGVTYIDVQADPHKLRNGNSGEIIWLDNISREWEDKKYYYPIPQSHILLNPNLEQNSGWD
ncbi:RagB/SusD family nutrient uptake outer membrane protein [Negadavirga shengliensis]|uniref:RagB/SusD family nutrient uptake outer membrane protein n=1 Tax=Negadavirga shengliensis TaxID=1389218 RepID=A0ABV9SXL2_9BACT